MYCEHTVQCRMLILTAGLIASVLPVKLNCWCLTYYSYRVFCAGYLLAGVDGHSDA
jgi:hypothetical protein